MKASAGRYMLFGLAIAAVVVAVVAGLVILGSPAEERERKMDNVRVEELAAIGRAIDLHYSRTGTLPDRLSDLTRPSEPTLRAQDPGTGQPYEYRVLGPKRFELCARFQRDSPSDGVRRDFWFHGSGRQCFQLEIQEVRR